MIKTRAGPRRRTLRARPRTPAESAAGEAAHSSRGRHPDPRPLPAVTLPERSRRRRLLVLVICASSLFIVGLDSTIVNIALPAIGRDLHASVAGLQWTVDGYALVLAS